MLPLSFRDISVDNPIERLGNVKEFRGPSVIFLEESLKTLRMAGIDQPLERLEEVNSLARDRRVRQGHDVERMVQCSDGEEVPMVSIRE